ncbi:hypothetical protein GMA11_06905 [Granulicatella sp. zg-ZJ]|uniref:hypothetical protein n=1 Tax=Granulicatella sp. zg-ZJ TaxID=2678504 RepID=UPI0013D3D8DF|nr:hypothetical protein [Granulicatella sp. zg-ZJ]NEW63123.1 hypothetical protein [Granulicatella sp. zg-ZJ]
MLFKSYETVISNKSKCFFLNDIHLIGTMRAVILEKRYLIPWNSTAVAKTKSIGIKKLYSEFLDRHYIGYQLHKKNQLVYGKGVSSIVPLKRKDICYGVSEKYGVIDTTGTAGGCLSSSTLFQIALLELIEKNELMLFWYGSYGYRYYLKKQSYLNLIKMFNKDYKVVDEIKIFCIKNLSSAVTIIVALFKKKNFVGSGIAASLIIDEAIEKAVNESKNLLLAYYHVGNLLLNDKLCKEVSVHLQKKELYSKKINYNLKESTFKLKKWINDIVTVFLPFSCGNEKVIKVCSQKLINCIPLKENLMYLDKEIFYHFDLDIESDVIPNCCII